VFIPLFPCNSILIHLTEKDSAKKDVCLYIVYFQTSQVPSNSAKAEREQRVYIRLNCLVPAIHQTRSEEENSRSPYNMNDNEYGIEQTIKLNESARAYRL
jgi:hypothetical protein